MWNSRLTVATKPPSGPFRVVKSWCGPYSRARRSAVAVNPTPRRAGASPSGPGPSSPTSSTSRSPSRRARTVIVPAPRTVIPPCRMAFSTSGCRIIDGTTAASAPGSTTTSTLSALPKRAFIRDTYSESTSSSSRSATSSTWPVRREARSSSPNCSSNSSAAFGSRYRVDEIVFSALKRKCGCNCRRRFRSCASASARSISASRRRRSFASRYAAKAWRTKTITEKPISWIGNSMKYRSGITP